MRILILCTGNSCRSQMAEGFMRSFDTQLNVFSAGTQPEKDVNPNAIKVMQEIGIDISGNKPKNVNEFLEYSFDYVITVCDNAKESCPAFSGRVKNRIHIGFEDPADAKGNEEEILEIYRSIRDQIKINLMNFYNEKILWKK
jgi:arsenate reductase (thioredoxin)